MPRSLGEVWPAVERWIPEGTTIGGRWRILGLLGSGGFGQVLLAEDISEVGLGRAAVKVLHPGTSPQERREFLGEVKKIAVLRHQNLVGYLDSGQLCFDGVDLPDAGGEVRPYLVTELCERSLHDHIAASPGGRLPGPETLAVLADVAAGLAHLHQRGLIHRDIKPGNVLYADGRWKLADFGLMRDLSATGSYHRGELLMGTPIFMAPELFTTMTATPPSDVYAFGVLAHLGATGRALHTGAGPALVHNITAVPRWIDPGLDPRLGQLVERCTDPRPEARPTAQQLAEALSGDQVSAIPPTWSAPPAPSAAAPLATATFEPPPPSSFEPPAPSSFEPPRLSPFEPPAPSSFQPPSRSGVATDGAPSWSVRRSPLLVAAMAAVGLLVLTTATVAIVLTRSADQNGDGETLAGEPVGGEANGPDPASPQAQTSDDPSAGDGVDIGDGVVIGGEGIGGEDSSEGAPSLEPVPDPLGHLDPVPCADGPVGMISVTNLHSEPVDYQFAIDHLDSGGARIEQSFKTVYSLPPGQSALVGLGALAEDATGCEVESFTATPTPTGIQATVGRAEIVSCVLDEFFGNWYDIVYTVENPTGAPVTASTAFGIVDADGVRIDGSFPNNVHGIDPGERVRAETFAVYRNMDGTDREPVGCVITRNELSPE